MLQIKRPAFTLVELIIVVLIIGLVYGLFVSGLNKKKQTAPFHFETLKEKMLELSHNRPVSLRCGGEACETCTATPEGESEGITLPLFSAKPTVFIYDYDGYFREQRYAEGVCFEYTVRDNLSSDSVLVEKDGRFYLFHAFLQRTDVFVDLEEAKRAFDPAEQLPTDQSEYYAKR